MARKKSTPKTELAARAGSEASTDMSERSRGGKSSKMLNENALHQLRAAEEGEREGHIAGMAEAAAMCSAAGDVVGGSFLDGANDCRDDILTELRRRYGADNPRVLHHLKLRGLA